jgi:hypothetical protein
MMTVNPGERPDIGSPPFAAGRGEKAYEGVDMKKIETLFAGVKLRNSLILASEAALPGN